MGMEPKEIDSKQQIIMSASRSLIAGLRKMPLDQERRKKIIDGVASATSYECCSWISYYSGEWSDAKASAEEILQILMDQGANDDVIAGVREAVSYFDGGVNALNEAYGSACTA